MVAGKFQICASTIWIARAFLFASVTLMVPGLHADDLPLDLALIDREHVGFVQVRLADLWKSGSLAPVRMLAAKAGPEMVKVFDQRFVPAPSSVDRLTVIFAANAQRPNPLRNAILVVTTSQPFDRARLVKGLLPQGVESKSGTWTRFADAASGATLCVLDQCTFAMGPTAAVNRLTVKPRSHAGKLQRAVDLATSGPSLVAAVQPESFLPAIQEMALPPQLFPVASAQTIRVAAWLVNESRVDFRMEFARPQEAVAGEHAVRFAIDLARERVQTARTEMEALVKGPEAGKVGSGADLPKAAAGLLGLGVIEMLDEQLAKLPLQRKGIAVTLSMELPAGPYGSLLAWGGFSAGLFLPAAQKVREASSRVQSANNLKQLALAMLFYHDANGRFPAAAICDKAGKPLLSWRVALLPYLEKGNDLFQKFHLDEPWDSKHNLPLLKEMPAIYALPSVSRPGDTQTYYRVFVGPDAVFELDKGRRLADITDGISNTWLIAEAGQAVPWTKPEELVYKPDKPVPKLGNFFSGGSNVVFADAAVHFIKKTLPEATIRAMITHAGGENIESLP